MEDYGLAILVQKVVDLLYGRLPEAREAARSVLVSTYSASIENEDEKHKDWQSFF